MRNPTPERMPGPRDVLSAWLLCALIAAAALGLADLHSGPASQPIAAEYHAGTHSAG